MSRIVIFLFSALVFSASAMADVEETYTYGTPYTNWDSYNGGGT